ncbi:MAG: nucleoside triphosphate pyrophosphohydrolase family protein [Halobacteriales archaeon]|nr:nucleoside triphosphate pyrophosphohydrolase family protein [Halobacteriales archaeon]
MKLNDYQAKASQTDRNKRKDWQGRMAPVLGLASEAGAVLEIYKRLLRDNVSKDQVRDLLKQELGDVMWFCAAIASANDLDLEEIAAFNLKRTKNRYGTLDLKVEPDFEKGFSLEQRFPRRLVIQFKQSKGAKGRPENQLVLVDAQPNAFPKGSKPGSKPGKRIGYDVGRPLGDPLTDHQRKEDAYRFHDAIHLGFMAVLGWSPVMRYVLRIKRKADPDTEEGEDSARQAFAEEGLSAVLAQMAKRRLGFLHDRSVNEDVLDVVRAITDDIEVKACSDQLWARAITQGFTAMHNLAEHGGGFLVADLDARTLEFRSKWP